MFKHTYVLPISDRWYILLNKNIVQVKLDGILTYRISSDSDGSMSYLFFSKYNLIYITERGTPKTDIFGEVVTGSFVAERCNKTGKHFKLLLLGIYMLLIADIKLNL